MRKHSTVLTQIFLQIHSKQRFRLNIFMYIPSLLSKTCSSGIVFGKFNQIYPCTFKDLTIFNVFSYLHHVKRLGICLPRGQYHQYSLNCDAATDAAQVAYVLNVTPAIPA